jgi:ATP-dependent DNA helicase RecG
MEGVRRALAEGRQIYVVRPAIEDKGAGLKAAREGLREYADRFPEARAALVHGKLSTAERQANLAAFAEGVIQILVATTVIEVGIDVPSASVIVVEDADRFGLAQLHQLRGRVGRGDVRSYCVLVASAEATAEALVRLRVLEQTDDGFKVAEKDLELRGPGEFAGTAQWGAPSFRVADLVRHQDLLLAARAEAFALVARRGEAGVAPGLLAETIRRHGERLRLAEVG